MSLYHDIILPRLIHFACSRKTFQQRRAALIPSAHGKVLDIGCGSGLNLAFFDREQVDMVYGLEPNNTLSQMAAKRATALALPYEPIEQGAENMPLPDASIDTITITFTLCSIAQVEQALDEARRVLKPSGQLLFCEHGLAPDKHIQHWQNRINPAWKKLAGGCHLNRDIPALIESAGFTIGNIQQGYLSGPKTLAFISSGRATTKP